MDIFDIALTMTPGLGVRGAVHLLEHFGTAVRIFSAPATSSSCEAEKDRKSVV